MKSNNNNSPQFLSPKDLLELAYQRKRAFPCTGNIDVNISKAYKDYQRAVLFLNEISEDEKPSDADNKKTLEKETLEKESFDFEELCRRANAEYIPRPCAINGHTKTAKNYIKRLQHHYQEVSDKLEEQVRVPRHLLEHESQLQAKCRKAYHYITADLHFIKLFNKRVTDKTEDFTKKDISRISHISRRYQEKKLTIEELVKQIDLEEQASEIF
jgi:hypothetical protein